MNIWPIDGEGDKSTLSFGLFLKAKIVNGDIVVPCFMRKDAFVISVMVTGAGYHFTYCSLP